jgi:hypothetical protein
VRIDWDQPGDRQFEAGVDRAVLYVGDAAGVPWNGIVSINENPSGGAATPYYFDGEKYLNLSAPEEYQATLTAFTYPDAFGVCDGSAAVTDGLFILYQPRQPFSLSYRTKIGNDLSPDFSYKIHIVYNALAAPSQRSNQSLSATSNISDFAWLLTSTPNEFSGYKPSSHVVIDTRYIHSGAVALLEAILYGDSTHDARIPTLMELRDIMIGDSDIIVVDNGDGTFDALGPDENVALFTGVAQSWVLWFAANENGYDDVSYAITPPVGYTSQITNGAQTLFPTAMLADNESASTGATGDKTGTSTSAAYWNGVMVNVNGYDLEYRATPALTQHGTDPLSISIDQQVGTAPGDMIFIYLFGANGGAVACDGFDVELSGSFSALLSRQADGTEPASFTISTPGGKNVTAIIATISGVVSVPIFGAMRDSGSAVTSFAVASVTVETFPTAGLMELDWSSVVEITHDVDYTATSL